MVEVGTVGGRFIGFLIEDLNQHCYSEKMREVIMDRDLTVDSYRSNDSSDCYVIAEIGHNHQGSLEKAKQMFYAAEECGVNAVKLQKRDNRTLYTREIYDMPYTNENSFGPTYGSHREALEFGRDDYLELKRYARELGLTMFATAFDFPSADFLAELDMPAYNEKSDPGANQVAV